MHCYFKNWNVLSQKARKIEISPTYSYRFIFTRNGKHTGKLKRIYTKSSLRCKRYLGARLECLVGRNIDLSSTRRKDKEILLPSYRFCRRIGCELTSWNLSIHDVYEDKGQADCVNIRASFARSCREIIKFLDASDRNFGTRRVATLFPLSTIKLVHRSRREACERRGDRKR